MARVAGRAPVGQEDAAGMGEAGAGSFLRHRNFVYLKAALALSAVATLGYLLIDAEPRPNGGTPYGYLLGTLGAGMIIWLSLLGIRKRTFDGGNWRLKGWTSAHVYLGVALAVIGTLHTGFQFGWNVHTLAWALMLLVIGSGLFGVYYYTAIPARMSRNRAQTSQAEMLAQLAEVDRELMDAVRPLPDAQVAIVEGAIRRTRLGGSLFARLATKHRSCPTTRAIATLDQVARALQADQRAPVNAVIAVLERKRVLLDRTRRHIRFKTLLELWLFVHIPATLALLAALVAHIVSVFVYW